MKTAEPRQPSLITSNIGFIKWHDSKKALSKRLFKNLQSLKIISVTSTSLKLLQLMNRQFLNTQLSNSTTLRIVFSNIQFWTKQFSKKLEFKLPLINFILINCEFLKVEESKILSAINLLGNFITSLDNFFSITLIFGVKSKSK
jgi:hypothetical protein